MFTRPKLMVPDHIARGMLHYRSNGRAFDNRRFVIYEPSMRRVMFKSKIHRATVTQADVDYEGSVTLDPHLLEAADILPYEQVHIWNVTRGTRLQTYAIVGEAGTGVCCINGAAAHLMQPGDLVIIATFTELDEAEAKKHKPRVVLVDAHNRVRQPDAVEVPGPRRRV